MSLPNVSLFQASHVGIALTDTSVKIAQVNKSGELTAFSSATLGGPLNKGGQISSQDITQALKQASTKLQFTTKVAAVCIPEKFAFSREYILSQVKPEEIEEAIHWQIEKIFPFSANEIYIDWKLLSMDKRTARVFVVAVPKELLNQIKQALEASGFLPISFEPSASAITRLIPTTQNNKMVVVELDETGSTSTLVVNGISSITTTTTFLPSSSPQETLSDLVESIQNLILQLDQKNIDSSDVAIYIAGEKSSPQLAQILQQSLKREVFPVQIPHVKPEQQLAFVAAKTQIKPPSSRETINLLPPALQEHYRARATHQLAQLTLKLIMALALPSLLLSLAGLVVTQIKLNALQAEVASAKQAQPTPVNSTSTINGQISVPQINTMVQRINKLFPQKVTPEQPITQVLNLIPKQIHLTNLLYERSKKQFTLTGVAPSRQELFTLQTMLEKDEHIGKVTLPLSSLESTDDIQFSLSFTYEDL